MSKSRNTFLDGDSAGLESNLKFVKNEFEEGLRGIFEPESSGNSENANSRIIQPDPGDNIQHFHKWTKEQTDFLLNLYELNHDDIGPLKQFKNKRNMYSFMAKQISSEYGIQVTGLQVETKYKTVLKRRKTFLRKELRKSELAKQELIKEEQKMINNAVESIVPDVLGRVLSPDDDSALAGSTQGRPPRNRKSIFEKVANQLMEEKRERAHERKEDFERYLEEKEKQREDKNKRHEDRMRLEERKIKALEIIAQRLNEKL